MSERPDRLSRRLGLGDATLIGLGSMLGAGIFAALAPAASAASAGLLLGLLLAGTVALFNAMSSAQLARLYPASGGTYVYARERLGPGWGWMAGWAFVVGKLASCAAVALTFGHYVLPGQAQWLAAGAVAVLTALNYRGVRKTATATKVIVAVVLTALAAAVLMMLSGGVSVSNLRPLLGPEGAYGVLQSAGLWFFAFAGYARIATLGEEVREPERNIPRAMFLGLGAALAAYAAVALSALLLVGPDVLVASDAPLVTAVTTAGFGRWSWVVSVGAAFATLGVLLSLLAGVSRMLFAMAADRRLPSYLARVHPRYRVPYLAEVTVGVLVIAVVLLADVRSAIGFSSFTVLLYYAVANLSAFTLRDEERLYRKGWAVLGLGGCLALSFTLPLESVAVGGLVMLAGLVINWLRSRRA